MLSKEYLVELGYNPKAISFLNSTDIDFLDIENLHTIDTFNFTYRKIEAFKKDIYSSMSYQNIENAILYISKKEYAYKDIDLFIFFVFKFTRGGPTFLGRVESTEEGKEIVFKV